MSKNATNVGDTSSDTRKRQRVSNDNDPHKLKQLIPQPQVQCSNLSMIINVIKQLIKSEFSFLYY